MKFSTLATALLFAIVTSIGFGAPAHAKTLRYATQDEPQTLDPHSANLAVANQGTIL